jgi:hypothetical protein
VPRRGIKAVWVYKRYSGQIDEEVSWVGFYYASIKAAADSNKGTPLLSAKALRKRLRKVPQEVCVELSNDLRIKWVYAKPKECSRRLYRVLDYENKVIISQSTVSEAAAQLGVAPNTIYGAVRDEKAIRNKRSHGWVTVHVEKKVDAQP